MIALIIVIVVAVAVVGIIAVMVVGRNRRPDGVAEFQRQIDALSSEARRPVVDQVQQLEDGADNPAAPPPEAEEDDRGA